ncbi:MAG: hypothetical protein GX883_04275, partial [Firmicutes bacterium]|nr:hypothetical protein [Bacillota bacterium]
KVMEAFLAETDYLIMDLKLSDPQRHRRHTGRSNEVILNNLALAVAARNRDNFLIRVPLIPGYTADRENIRGIAAILNRVGFDGTVELIPYHRLGAGKYSRLGLQYELNDISEPPQAQLDEVRRWFTESGIPVLTQADSSR